METEIAEVVIPPLSADKVVVLSGHVMTIPLALLFSYLTCSYPQLNTLRRHISATIGVLLVIWCYRWECSHLLFQWAVSYVLYRLAPRDRLARYTFIVCFSHVLLANFYKFAFHYGDFPIDYTCTLMLGTMKMTSFAFSVQDSTLPAGRLNQQQLQQVISGQDGVSGFDHFCYYFSFVGLIFGPFIFYNEHKQFMERPIGCRTNYRLAATVLLYGLACVAVHLISLPYYDVTLNADPHMLSQGFLYRQYILFVTMFVARCKYYFVWLSAQSVAMFAGMGHQTWYCPLTATVNPLQIELATSLKQFIDNWNIFTARWLRFVVYDRVRRQKSFQTFVVSAVWHGFYPGYLLMFVPLAFYSVLGTKLHKVVRPVFQRSRLHILSYAVVTWLGTAVTVYFNGTAFQLLYLSEIYKVQSRLYFYPHIVAILLFVIVPSPKKGDHVSGETTQKRLDDRKSA